ncbi:hypothetical protein [Pedobacter agri]|uniref:Uncharacterized protein n=1 Tax=Pedobacter agri TaxID=454586 RepID=A0A9X3I9C3_9SPHI|nr:hypothetical protein [Pedobacter agri]MCX3264854.1 hypothetical protein [Pedobacter agri]
MKMWYYVITVLILGVLVAAAFNFSQYRKTAIDELPKSFLQYQSLDRSEVITSSKVSMRLVMESTVDIQYFMTASNELIVYAVPRPEENVFSKFNEQGEVTDSLIIHGKPSDIAFIDGLVINKGKHQYYQWSFDGSSEAKNIVMQNEDFKWNSTRQQELLEKVVHTAKSVYVEYDSDSPAPQKMEGDKIQIVPSIRTFAKLTYFDGGNCYQFFTTLNVYKQFPYAATQELLMNNIFKRINTKVSGDKEIIQTPFIRYRYFQKLKREKVRFPGGGGNMPGYDKILFHGNLFTDLVYKNDTLRVKEFMYLEQDRASSSIQIAGESLGTFTKNKVRPISSIEAYMYYSHPNLSYALFTNSDKKLYIIK